ncbi:tRNA 2-thiouridine(34) synthase MnmA [Geminocystis herdmanii]|uniref:tRNA 2-thiouridine(34) synthase MnmA n=1 Tax=Geminocystis herdmanii TaxID=669359 RepID=UPI0003467DF4|nr:tRNA 2-thiouridine(34) synthase MnmA [Geminocystis herdmanii]
MVKVVVGLSGGVDSSVAAASLQSQGYEVEGLTLWLMKGKGQCCSDGMVDAAHLCEQLGIPHHVVDTRELFQTYIVDYVVSGYESGVTPLPCSQCNRVVKFPPMLEYAQQNLGIDKIATGHYARINYDEKLDRYQLLKAIDDTKDQSYFLYDLTQDLLSHLIFPLGEQTKAETRVMASKFELKTADKPDSQDLCLIETHGSMKDFLDKYIQPKQGQIVDLEGNILGEHTGIHHYTIGQRKGLGIAYAEPLYVVKLDPVMNHVVVATRDQGGRTECIVGRMNWVSIAPPENPIKAEAKIRYRTPPKSVNVIPLDSQRIKLIFDEPQFGITPGQAAVLYHEDLLLGGGIIDK